MLYITIAIFYGWVPLYAAIVLSQRLFFINRVPLFNPLIYMQKPFLFLQTYGFTPVYVCDMFRLLNGFNRENKNTN